MNFLRRIGKVVNLIDCTQVKIEISIHRSFTGREMAFFAASGFGKVQVADLPFEYCEASKLNG